MSIFCLWKLIHRNVKVYERSVNKQIICMCIGTFDLQNLFSAQNSSRLCRRIKFECTFNSSHRIRRKEHLFKTYKAFQTSLLLLSAFPQKHVFTQFSPGITAEPSPSPELIETLSYDKV